MGIVDIIRTLAENHPKAVVVTDAQLDRPGPFILYVNPVFTQMTGYRADEVIGSNPRMLQGPATKPLSIRALGRALRRTGHFEGTVINHRKSGEEYICQVEVHPIAGPSGQTEYFVAFEQEVRRRRGRPSKGANGRFEPVSYDVRGQAPALPLTARS